MKTARENQLGYLFLAIIMIPLGVYLNYGDIMAGEFPEAIMIFSLGTSALMMAYLSPHLFPKDERTKEIIGRSMTINYFTLFLSILVLFYMTTPAALFLLNASQVLVTLTAIMTTAIPLTMIVYAKRI